MTTFLQGTESWFASELLGRGESETGAVTGDVMPPGDVMLP